MDYFKRLGDWIKNLYKNFYFIIILIVGLGLGFVNNTWLNDKTVGFLAEGILASGVFTTALKTFQFTEIFKEELSKVIISNTFLEILNEKRLEELWTDCSKIISQRRFPEISDDLFKFVRQNYLMVGLEYYYSEIQMTIALSYFDEANNLILSEETTMMKIKAVNKNHIVYKFGSTIDKAFNLKAEDAYRLVEFSVNGEPRPFNPLLVESTDKKKWEVRQEVPLNGALEYTIVRREKRVESMKTNSDFLTFKIGRLTKKWHFNVENSTKFALDYVTFGTMGDFVDDVESLKLHGYDLSKVSNSFILYGQGFSILLK